MFDSDCFVWNFVFEESETTASANTGFVEMTRDEKMLPKDCENPYVGVNCL